jgi:pyruvate/2-oxoglutarate dehydrogenase complex dihydrolipoamide dehydrogenase (E3) component
VDSGLRTSNPRVFAIGDVAGGPQFIHAAGHHAGIVIRRALFRLPARALGAEAVPRVTYTDPELAQVGLDEAAARARHGEIRVLRWPFAENDRARAERDTDGLIKLVATPRGRLLGAGIAGAGAGDQIQPWVLALAKGIGLRDMAGLGLPYPTRGEAGKRAAGEFFRAQLFSTRTRGLLDLLARLG